MTAQQVCKRANQDLWLAQSAPVKAEHVDMSASPSLGQAIGKLRLPRTASANHGHDLVTSRQTSNLVGGQHSTIPLLHEQPAIERRNGDRQVTGPYDPVANEVVKK